MSFNSFGHLFRVTTFGESHGPAIGCVVDGCPPLLPLSEADIDRLCNSTTCTTDLCRAIERLITEKSEERATANLAVERFIAKSPSHAKHYEDAYNTFTAILRPSAD